MTYIILGAIRIGLVLGSVYALSRFISKFVNVEEQDLERNSIEEKFSMFMMTICGLGILGVILMLAYVVGGGE